MISRFPTLLTFFPFPEEGKVPGTSPFFDSWQGTRHSFCRLSMTFPFPCQSLRIITFRGRLKQIQTVGINMNQLAGAEQTRGTTSFGISWVQNAGSSQGMPPCSLDILDGPKFRAVFTVDDPVWGSLQFWSPTCIHGKIQQKWVCKNGAWASTNKAKHGTGSSIFLVSRTPLIGQTDKPLNRYADLSLFV